MHSSPHRAHHWSGLLGALALAMALLAETAVTPIATAAATAVASRTGGATRLTSASTSASSAAAPTLRNRCTRNSRGVPSCGVLWGAYLSPRPSTGATWRQPYPALERKVDRRFDLVKFYESWDGSRLFPNAAQRQQAEGTGRMWEVSWSAYRNSTGKHIRYQAIADGRFDDSVIRPQAEALKSWGHRVIFDFDHEMEGKRPHGGRGSAAQYKAAFRHIVRVFRAVGAHNVKWAWVPMGWAPARFASYYPGKKYVDWVGWDPYNFSTCTGSHWKSPLQTFSPFYRWARSHAGTRKKPFMMGEYATTNGPGAHRWYARVHRALSRLPRIKALIQFGSAPSPRCNFDLRTSSSALSGFRRSGRAAYVLGR